MKKTIVAVILGFIVTFVANTIIALTIIGPLFNQALGIVRTREQGLNVPSILIGYLLVAVGMTWIIQKVQYTGWLKAGVIVGAITGIMIFVAGHMIIAGWSTIDSSAFIYSGLFDAISPIFGGAAISYVLKRK